ncbi:MAG: hypothetical protein HYW48_03715 [Deltaproteobacteria bacterium]|nr:hypothetical protein [Deltaproteobacteria bacterium]
MKHLLAFFTLSFLLQCSYRFSNQHVRIPTGTETIAIEAIFDTGRSVLPHNLLWESLQRAFAANGHLRVSSMEKADLYLRAHLTSTRFAQSEWDSFSKARKPSMFLKELPETPGGETSEDVEPEPFAPTEYLNLHSADIFSKRQSLSFLVEVEIWDLRKKTIILSQSYPMGNTFNMFSNRSTIESRFLRNEEGIEHLFAKLSESIANAVVTELLAPAYSFD